MTSHKSLAELLEEPVSEVAPATPAQLNALYRRLDLRIIPALWCLYFLTSFGSSAYGNALTMNKAQGHLVVQTLGLNTHHTRTALALYYVGYIIFDVPMNLAMTRLQPQLWLLRIVITVGLVYTCYVALKGPRGLIAIRFMLGMVGAGTWPGMSYYILLWYPNERSARRIGYYYTAAQLLAAAAGLVLAGFQKMDMTHGWEGWRWLYLVYGVITMAVGILLMWWLPDRPVWAKSLTSWLDRFSPPLIPPLSEPRATWHRLDMEERYKRITYGWRDLVNILADPRTWPLIICYFGVVGCGFGLAVFGTTIILANNPHLLLIDALLLYAPIWLFDLAAIVIVTPFADRYKRHRYLFFAGSLLIIIVGLLVMTYAKGAWSRYGGLLICGFGLGPTVPTVMAWAAEISHQRYGDVGVAVSAALVSGLGNLGSVTSTYALYSGWPADKARLYQYSNMMLLLMVGVGIVSAFVLQGMRIYLGDLKEHTPDELLQEPSQEPLTTAH